MSEPSKTTKVSNEPVAPATAPTDKKNDNTKTILIVVGVLAVIFIVVPVVLVSVGAGIVGHKISKEVKVSNNGNTTTIKTKNGDEITAGTSKTLPKDFPSSVTVYKGTIVSSSRLTFEGKTTYSVAIETKDDPTKVSESLTQSFSTNGWTTNLNTNSNDGGLISAQNGDLRAQVLFTTKNGKTTISYTIVPVTNS